MKKTFEEAWEEIDRELGDGGRFFPGPDEIPATDLTAAAESIDQDDAEIRAGLAGE